MKIRWIAALALLAVTVLAVAGTTRAHARALVLTDDQSGYFGSGHDPQAAAASLG